MVGFIRVGIDSLDHFRLFADHGSQLPKTATSVNFPRVVHLSTAACSYIDPSSLIVASMASMACPRCWI